MIEVQRAENDLQPFELGAFVPAPGDEIPFGIEFPTHDAAIASINRSQNDGRIVISGHGRQLLERGTVQIDGPGTGERLEFLECVGRLRGEHAGNDRKEDEEGGPGLHFGIPEALKLESLKVQLSRSYLEPIGMKGGPLRKAGPAPTRFPDFAPSCLAFDLQHSFISLQSSVFSLQAIARSPNHDGGSY